MEPEDLKAGGSTFWKKLSTDVDLIDQIYSVQYMALSHFFMGATKTPDEEIRFTPPGSYAPFRPAMAYGEIYAISKPALQKTAVNAVNMLGCALHEYMYQVGRRAYEARIGKPLIGLDNSWYRSEMVGVVTGVDPKDCICWPQIERIENVCHMLRTPTCPVIEEITQDDFFRMCKAVKAFALDFERGLEIENKGLML